jgi:hypothetical protein
MSCPHYPHSGPYLVESYLCSWWWMLSQAAHCQRVKKACKKTGGKAGQFCCKIVQLLKTKDVQATFNDAEVHSIVNERRAEVEEIKYGSQSEYNRVLDAYSAQVRKLSQTQCEDILISHGASSSQAKNGAYVYLHHSGNLEGFRTGSREEYKRLLDEFEASSKSSQQCIKYLEGLGYRYGQSKTAVYNYRRERGLIGK